MLTHWLSRTSTLFLTEAIYYNIFRCNYLRNKKYFLNFFLHFSYLDSNLKFFKKEMSLRADAFLKLRTPNNVIIQMSEMSRFRGLFDKLHGNRAETLLKSERHHLYHIYWPLRTQFTLKKSLWVIYKFLGLFANPSTANNKYSLLKRDNL